MDLSHHALTDLFDQLGLPSSAGDIGRFIEQHRPLPRGMELADAPFWTEAQSHFLREEIEEDADWAELVDELDAMLRAA